MDWTSNIRTLRRSLPYYRSTIYRLLSRNSIRERKVPHPYSINISTVFHSDVVIFVGRTSPLSISIQLNSSLLNTMMRILPMSPFLLIVMRLMIFFHLSQYSNPSTVPSTVLSGDVSLLLVIHSFLKLISPSLSECASEIPSWVYCIHQLSIRFYPTPYSINGYLFSTLVVLLTTWLYLGNFWIIAKLSNISSIILERKLSWLEKVNYHREAPPPWSIPVYYL